MCVHVHTHTHIQAYMYTPNALWTHIKRRTVFPKIILSTDTPMGHRLSAFFTWSHRLVLVFIPYLFPFLYSFPGYVLEIIPRTLNCCSVFLKNLEPFILPTPDMSKLFFNSAPIRQKLCISHIFPFEHLNWILWHLCLSSRRTPHVEEELSNKDIFHPFQRERQASLDPLRGRPVLHSGLGIPLHGGHHTASQMWWS